jgi:hypothetical protein
MQNAEIAGITEAEHPHESMNEHHLLFFPCADAAITLGIATSKPRPALIFSPDGNKGPEAIRDWNWRGPSRHRS